MSEVAPKRPVVRYHGGKWKLAPWIIRHFPKHRVYVEPFGGGGSVLLRKPRAYAEVYNDLDGELVNLFRVVRDRGPELVRAIELTPFARDEYAACLEDASEPLERARRTIARSFMGFGSNALVHGVNSGFRANSNRSGTTPAADWRNYPSCLPAVIGRLRGIIIENKDATGVMAQHDSPETLHYCDPPYVKETRGTDHGYNHEMSNSQHSELAAFLVGLKGMVIVSGYRCELYDGLYWHWRRIDCKAHADGARDRVESLWLSPNTHLPQGQLLEQAA